MNLLLLALGISVGIGLAYHIKGPALTVMYVLALCLFLFLAPLNEADIKPWVIKSLLIYIYSIVPAIITTLVVNGTFESVKTRLVLRGRSVLEAFKTRNLKTFLDEYVLREGQLKRWYPGKN